MGRHKVYKSIVEAVKKGRLKEPFALFWGDNDDEFWKERNEIINYHKDVHDGVIDPEEIVPANNKDLYLIAKQASEKHGGFTGFDETELEDALYELETVDIQHAIFFGIVGVFAAYVTDYFGKDLEKFIDGKLPKDYDKNNPFDFKKGTGHRYDLFHDFNLLKKIPKDFHIDTYNISVQEFLGISALDPDPTILDLMVKMYCKNKSGFFSKSITIAQRIIGHYSKDFVTPDGLPIPFSSIFTRYINSMTNICGYSNSNVLMGTLKREYGSLHSSDLASIAIMKALLAVYIKGDKFNYYTKSSLKIVKNQLNIIAYGTCMILQLLLLLWGKEKSPKKNIVGGKLNLVLATLFLTNTRSLIVSINKEHRLIMDFYEERIQYYEHVEDEELSILMLKEYRGDIKEPYHFESTDNYFCSVKIINEAFESVKNEKNWDENSLAQINALYQLEIARYDFACNKIDHDLYLKSIRSLAADFYNNYGISIFKETDIHDSFYEKINDLYLGKG